MKFPSPKIFQPLEFLATKFSTGWNLIHHGRWTGFWDAENRLTQVVTRAEAVSAGVTNLVLAFGSDWMGRRVSKQVYAVVSGTPSLQYAAQFTYDGWNMIAEVRTESTGATWRRGTLWIWQLRLLRMKRVDGSSDWKE